MSFKCNLFAAPATAWHQVRSCPRQTLGDSWLITHLPPESAHDPKRARSLAQAMNRAPLVAHGRHGACTVAAAIARATPAALAAAGLRSHGADGATRLVDLDAHDWWFRTVFVGSENDSGTGRAHLVLHGVATIADVWLNGVWLGRTDNMFVRWEADVSALLLEHNELVICARAMTPLLKPRRPRARWRARMLPSQEWRWHRTTQLGRLPGIGPATPPVGPWRPVMLEERAAVTVSELSVRPTVLHGVPSLQVSAVVRGDVESAVLVCDKLSEPAMVERIGGSSRDSTSIRAHVASRLFELWWPHTHGTPRVYPARLDLTLAGGSVVSINLGNVGFRTVSADTSDNGFAVVLNDHRLFLRGVCWTPRDWANVEPDEAALAEEMRLLVDGGVNCIRMSGCFTYPSHAFLAACDRFGVMVWQDLMFSVLDYPEHDPAFVAACETEVAQALSAMQAHSCVAVVCGNSEVAQLAVMNGIPPTEALHSLFRERLAAVAATALPDVPYWPSTPWGGVLPFQLGQGTAHYFGVGAYQRDLHDARRSGVRFATECLAFANVPEPESLQHDVNLAPGNTERWKARVPRDIGASWDFEDVRDHYVERLFGERTDRLRIAEPARYLALGRVASAVAVERTLQEFRRNASGCNGALLWLWSDPWPGAGWGTIDHAGRPKSVWYALRRASLSVALAITNEGLDGASLHAWNDSPHPVRGTVVLRLLRDGHEELYSRTVPLIVDARSAVTLSCDEILGRFTDIVYAYRFGLPSHDVVHAVWIEDDRSEPLKLHSTERARTASRFQGRRVIGEAVLLPHAEPSARSAGASEGVCSSTVIANDTGLFVEDIRRVNATNAVMTLSCTRVTPHVRVGSSNWIPDDSYFTLVPGVSKTVHLRQPVGRGRVEGAVTSTTVNVDAISSTRSFSVAVPEYELPVGAVQATAFPTAFDDAPMIRRRITERAHE